jgi:hypothetical protein
VRSMFHMSWSSGCCIRLAQPKPVGVRTMMMVVPGRLPLCHQFPAPLFRTIQTRAYRSGQAGAGMVMI